ncbi:hypothetical protein [Clostridium rectalis]|uniref:hypothetical protein n=1 Tax=Clostridium rectalis TaxID=2040295 RepID=UPI000F63D73A|nr:hypothetical protein [Clostridium rectalis]
MEISDILRIIDNISDELKDKVAPVEILNKFSGGRSGAEVYLVEYGEDNRVGILKISDSNESEVFQKAYELAAKNNMHKYIAKLITNYKIEDKGKTLYASLYDLAGDDIYKSETFLDKVINEDDLKDSMVSKITKFVFSWSKDHEKKYMCPTQIMKNELSYRYMDEKYEKAFEDIGVPKDVKWISLDGTDTILPNPYYFFNNENVWKGLKVTCLTSYAHGDFQGDNIIITENKPIIIDFCDLLEDCNVFHDLRYLEAITLGDYMETNKNCDKKLWVNACSSLSEGIMEVDIPQGKGMSLLRQLMSKLRENVKLIVSDARNVLYNPSFYLAGVAAGLINMRKYKSNNKKKAAFIYASYNLKMFLKDEAVDMFTPSLKSCMVFNWVNEIENSFVNLQPISA